MGYCDRCGTYADLDQAAMCGTCRAAWRPSAPAAADLGCHGQPQPSAIPELTIQLRDPGLQPLRVTRVDDPAQPV
jgi:hypothetical protein